MLRRIIDGADLEFRLNGSGEMQCRKPGRRLEFAARPLGRKERYFAEIPSKVARSCFGANAFRADIAIAIAMAKRYGGLKQRCVLGAAVFAFGFATGGANMVASSDLARYPNRFAQGSQREQSSSKSSSQIKNSFPDFPCGELPWLSSRDCSQRRCIATRVMSREKFLLGKIWTLRPRNRGPPARMPRCARLFRRHSGQAPTTTMRRFEADAKLKRLYDAIRNGVADLSDPMLKDRIVN